jgi:hypothetical protein
MLRLARIVPLALLVVMAAAPSVRGETLKDDRLGFTLQIPEGFVPYEELLGRQPKLAHAYLAHDPDGQRKYLLQIAPLGGILDREKLTKGQKPPEFKGKTFHVPWKGFEIEAFQTPEEIDDQKFLTYTVNVPLKRQAIQVSVSGAADRAEELETVFASVVANLEGESNWSTAATPEPPQALVWGSFVFMLVGLWGMWIASNRADLKWVLAVSIVMWLGGYNLSKDVQRDMKLIGASVSIVGMFGGVLALVKLMRAKALSSAPAATTSPSPGDAGRSEESPTRAN